ncbi:unnamed protein product [Malus baccata var. baccata]
MGDPLGSSRASSQKQNRKGVVWAQSGQYQWILYALYVHAHLHIARGFLGTHWLRVPSEPTSTRPFGNSLTSGSIGTSKLSEFAREQS